MEYPRPTGEVTLDEATVRSLREKHYNATVVDIVWQHEMLAAFRVKPDFPLPAYKPGQYTTLGLGLWEPRHQAAIPEPELDEKQIRRLRRRAYSISHPVVNGSSELFAPENINFLEFYIVMVVGDRQEPPPQLTPRLFLLKPGDRIFMGEKFTGGYTVDSMGDIRDKEDSLVVFAATGTGEGPHNNMIWELLRTGYQGRIASINCVRYKKDLAYERIYRHLEKKYPNLSYHTLTTREEDSVHQKIYIQDYIATRQFEKQIGREMSPEDTHVFLCGNPAMIGVPEIHNDQKIWPEGRPGVIEILEERGFSMDRGKHKGNIHFEKYW